MKAKKVARRKAPKARKVRNSVRAIVKKLRGTVGRATAKGMASAMGGVVSARGVFTAAKSRKG